MTTFKALFIIFILAFFSSCHLRDPSQTENSKKKKALSPDKDQSEALLKMEDAGPVWKYDCITDSIYKVKDFRTGKLSVNKAINLINSNYNGKVILDFVKIVKDTLFVKIGDSEFLTERMGTAGADEYMITTTFTLTEPDNIGFVNFSFDIGDHATPGTYSRKYFNDWIKMKKQ